MSDNRMLINKNELIIIYNRKTSLKMTNYKTNLLISISIYHALILMVSLTFVVVVVVLSII